MHLTHEMLEAGYEFLRVTPPFKGWKLPHADEVEFRVSKNGTHGGDYQILANGRHCIRINGKWCGTTAGLLKYLAHEMVHLHHGIACPSDTAHHGKEFKKFAASFCRLHHLDPKAF